MLETVVFSFARGLSFYYDLGKCDAEEAIIEKDVAMSSICLSSVYPFRLERMHSRCFMQGVDISYFAL